MISHEECSAIARQLMAYRNPAATPFYTSSNQSLFDMEEILLETVELMGNSRGDYLQSQVNMLNE